MILYLHGFRSSPSSYKARMLREYMQTQDLTSQYWCEQLPISPAEAIAKIEQQIHHCVTKPTLIGSSLGGYYATYLAEKHDLRAILVNPSVIAALTLQTYLGPQTNLYTGEVFELLPKHLAELRALEMEHITPQHYWLMVETGDEILDYRQAVTRYDGARQTILPGGDHSFTHWLDYLEEIIEFAQLSSRAGNN